MNIIAIDISSIYRQVSPLIIIQYLKDLGGGTGLFDLGHATYFKTVRETTHIIAWKHALLPFCLQLETWLPFGPLRSFRVSKLLFADPH